MVVAKPVSSPMLTSTTLSTFDSASFEDPTLYRGTVDALQYLCVTRPDISFIVNKLSQFMQKPSILQLAICAFWAILNGLFTLDCTFKSPLRQYSKLLLMRIGLTIVITSAPPEAIAFFLVTT
ncbi:hypothetical protein SLA2020_430560 [Shorea laevis]